MPECSLVQNFIPCFLTFYSTTEVNPYLPFEFLIFYHSSIKANGLAICLLLLLQDGQL